MLTPFLFVSPLHRRFLFEIFGLRLFSPPFFSPFYQADVISGREGILSNYICIKSHWSHFCVVHYPEQSRHLCTWDAHFCSVFCYSYSSSPSFFFFVKLFTLYFFCVHFYFFPQLPVCPVPLTLSPVYLLCTRRSCVAVQ